MTLAAGLLLQYSSTAMLLGAVLLICLFYLLYHGTSSQPEQKEPPGPKPMPFLGNLLQMDLQKLHLSLCELSKKYGSVFTVYFGPKKTVVLAGYKTVKNALVNYADVFGGRDIPPVLFDVSKGLGLYHYFYITNMSTWTLWANGDNWKLMRRFTLTTLRDFGMGKRGSEEKIIEETRYLKEVFEKFEGKPFDTTHPVNVAVSNIICTITYGSSFDYEDPKFKRMVDQASENMKNVVAVPVQLYNMFPKIFSRTKSWTKVVKIMQSNRNEMQQLMNSLKETVNLTDSRGLVDSIIRKALGENDVNFHDENLLATISNLFIAGTDTTSTTLRWGLLLMAKYPQIQTTVQEEISRVVGARQPVMDDRKNLPYTNAVIHETQRLASIIPMSLPHITTCYIQFQGFFIKKGTCVMPLLTFVLKDENEWESPHTFNPAHFLDEDGNFIKRDAFMPFSAGRRVCLGESLARMELFLFFTSLLQYFRFTSPPGISEDQLDLTPAVGFTLSPFPHQLCAVSRT